SHLLLVALVLIYCMLHVWWRDDPTATLQTLPKPDQPQRQRSTEPKPFTGLLRKPRCVACEQGLKAYPTALGAPPPLLLFTRGRRRTIDTPSHFCPDQECAYKPIVLVSYSLINEHRTVASNGGCFGLAN